MNRLRCRQETGFPRDLFVEAVLADEDEQDPFVMIVSAHWQS